MVESMIYPSVLDTMSVHMSNDPRTPLLPNKRHCSKWVQMLMRT